MGRLHEGPQLLSARRIDPILQRDRPGAVHEEPPNDVAGHAQFRLRIQEADLVGEERFIPADAGPGVVRGRLGSQVPQPAIGDAEGEHIISLTPAPA